MRIVGGTLKGHSLAGPTGQGTRPTSDRVRESIFNILAHGGARIGIEGCRVLDVFAGTGAMGFEALSRGARFCHFIDDDTAARGVIRRNADALGVIGQCKIWRRDATRLGPCAPLPPFDLVFADPPYGKGLGSKALASLVSGGWFAPGAILVVEEAKGAALALPPGVDIVDQRDYGDTQVVFLHAEENTP
ncbi:16S rRNA (guanine(966)-N(2))-methyltransferase RsmD [soil metagenome]